MIDMAASMPLVLGIFHANIELCLWAKIHVFFVDRLQWYQKYWTPFVSKNPRMSCWYHKTIVNQAVVMSWSHCLSILLRLKKHSSIFDQMLQCWLQSLFLKYHKIGMIPEVIAVLPCSSPDSFRKICKSPHHRSQKFGWKLSWSRLFWISMRCMQNDVFSSELSTAAL